MRGGPWLARDNNFVLRTSQPQHNKIIAHKFLSLNQFLASLIPQNTVDNLAKLFSRNTINHLQIDGSSEALSSVHSLVTELLLDSQDLVQLGQTLRSGWGTSLDLTSTETNNDISNGDIFSLSRTVGNHNTPSSAKESLAAWIDSVRVPIWLTFNKRALQDLSQWPS
ncbi:hypothetical protein EYC84_006504 [Monilinia fructicola]|uniref:Uncharacterized protein n=1 Tax=Monilinia fructicola TaxID=38448 RepID=A0A5M9K450_MONFR|nr:hypothetical protein EYC84_006504 [Monilinia fructicola]